VTQLVSELLPAVAVVSIAWGVSWLVHRRVLWLLHPELALAWERGVCAEVMREAERHALSVWSKMCGVGLGLSISAGLLWAFRMCMGLSFVWAVVVPLVGLQLGVPTLDLLLFRKRRARAIREQLLAHGIPVCLACGYDLRGRDSSRCPECGRVCNVGAIDQSTYLSDRPDQFG